MSNPIPTPDDTTQESQAELEVTQKQTAESQARELAKQNKVLSDKVKAFEEALYMALDARHKDMLENFRNGKLLDTDLAKLKELAADIANQVK